MLQRVRRSRSIFGLSNQTWMARKKLRSQLPGRAPPNQFEQAEQEEYFAACQEECRDHVAGPMRAQVNSRITDGCSNEPVHPAPASIKHRAKNSNHSVGAHVP